MFRCGSTANAVGDREIADSIALVRFRRCVSHRFGYLLDGHEAAGVDKKSGVGFAVRHRPTRARVNGKRRPGQGSRRGIIASFF